MAEKEVMEWSEACARSHEFVEESIQLARQHGIVIKPDDYESVRAQLDAIFLKEISRHYDLSEC
jgi:hypothetical protein